VNPFLWMTTSLRTYPGVLASRSCARGAMPTEVYAE
jgi:hypothetical protein